MTLNIAAVVDAVADALPDRAALISKDGHLTYAQLQEKTRRLANFLLSHDVKAHTERAALKNWEIGQDTVALYMLNCPAYIIGQIGAYGARAIPFNVNYRYVGEELEYLFNDARPRAIIYHGQFAETLAGVLSQLGSVDLLIQVDDGSGAALLPGAVDFDAALANASAEKPAATLSGDDIYCVYTGGTTGMPKGVLWRQEDSLAANLGGSDADGAPLPDLDAFVARAQASGGNRVLPASPFMHGAGSQTSIAAWCRGNTVVIQNNVERLDPTDLLETVDREKVNMMLLVGDAFGRPVAQAAGAASADGRARYDLSSVKVVYNTGAVMSPAVKADLLDVLPNARIVDAFGSTETGPQALSVSKRQDATPAKPRRFDTGAGTIVLSEDKTKVLAPGHDGFGWIAKKGRVPLGYLGDEARTRETFPEVDGARYVIGGDRVRRLANGEIEFHGRESFTINSGGEKIFAEEVELALKQHPGVADVVVTGRPSAQWGSEVVAIVQMEPGAPQDTADNRQALLDEAGQHIARYKLPKAFLILDRIQRHPNGKTDSRWAQSVAGDAT